MKHFISLLSILFLLSSCNNSSSLKQDNAADRPLMEKYTTFKLTSDLNGLTDNQTQIIKLLIQAGEIMDELFWYEAYGDRTELLAKIEDEDLKKFVMINYGPWDRLDDNKPFIDGVGKKPEGANFYPNDMDKKEFKASTLADKSSLYTFLRRDDEGKLITVPYHVQFADQTKKASDLLLQAAELANEAGLKKYLTLRAQALLDDKYFESDVAWMQMENNQIEVVIGPIENYEDHLNGAKAAHECFVLIKDMEWSEKLKKYAAFLPELQKGLPVPDIYKQDEVGRNSQLNAYDVVYYAGDCNAGSKTIAINLPNDEKVQEQEGSRRLQLKNAMRAKFDKILLPISEVLIVEDQRKYITFDAFFSNTMFHEVAHGLGIKNTIDGKSTVREVLKEHASALEEGKADILGLYMITQLHKKGELKGDLKNYYTTFMTSIFRSVRFGASSAHGKANMIRFNYFREKGAFERLANGTYRVHFDKLEAAATGLSTLILTLQGDGSYKNVADLVADKGVIGKELQADLDRLSAQGIPVDVVFEQGVDVLGL